MKHNWTSTKASIIIWTWYTEFRAIWIQWQIYNMLKVNTEYTKNGQCRESYWSVGATNNL